MHISSSPVMTYMIAWDSTRERNNLGQWWLLLLSELKWGGLGCELAEFTQNAAALLGLWRGDLALHCYYNPGDPGSEEESLGFASPPVWHGQFCQDHVKEKYPQACWSGVLKTIPYDERSVYDCVGMHATAVSSTSFGVWVRFKQKC